MGNLEVLQSFDNRVIGNQEVLNKYWARRYVVSREQYNWWLVGSDYDNVVALTDPGIFAEYGSQFLGEKGLDKVFGDFTERRIKVLSIAPAPTNAQQMVVRFERTTVSKGTNEAMRADPARSAATLAVEQDTARRWADLDSADFGRIRSDSRREAALEAIAGHIRVSPEYADELKKRSPVLAESAKAINDERVKVEREIALPMIEKNAAVLTPRGDAQVLPDAQLAAFGFIAAVTEAIGLVAGLDDVAVVGQVVQQRRGHLGIAEHAGPLDERQVGGDHHACVFVQLGQQVE